MSLGPIVTFLFLESLVSSSGMGARCLDYAFRPMPGTPAIRSVVEYERDGKKGTY